MVPSGLMCDPVGIMIILILHRGAEEYIYDYPHCSTRADTFWLSAKCKIFSASNNFLQVGNDMSRP